MYLPNGLLFYKGYSGLIDTVPADFITIPCTFLQTSFLLTGFICYSLSANVAVNCQVSLRDGAGGAGVQMTPLLNLNGLNTGQLFSGSWGNLKINLLTPASTLYARAINAGATAGTTVMIGFYGWAT